MTVGFCKTKIKISFLFAFSVTVLSVCDRSNLILFNILSAVIHETGHLLSMVIFGETPEKIELTPFGMKIKKNRADSMGFTGEIVTALAGPLMNFMFAGILFTAGKVFQLDLSQLMTVNIIIGSLNLLVCEPLDGYRAVKYLMLKKISEEKTEKILKITSLFFIFPVALAGFYVLIKSRYNFSLLLIGIYLCSFLIKGQRKK